MYTFEEQLWMLTVRPGITDLASLSLPMKARFSAASSDPDLLDSNHPALEEAV